MKLSSFIKGQVVGWGIILLIAWLIDPTFSSSPTPRIITIMIFLVFCGVGLMPAQIIDDYETAQSYRSSTPTVREQE